MRRSLLALPLVLLVAGCPPRPPVSVEPASTAPPDVVFTEVGYEIARREAARPRTPQPFTAFAAHEDYSVRVRAAVALGRAGEAQGPDGSGPFVDALAPLLSDPKAQVRRAAVTALGIIGEPAGGRISEVWPAETDLEVRRLAVRAMARIVPVDEKKAVDSPEMKILVGLLDNPAFGAAAAVSLGIYGRRATDAGAKVPALSEKAGRLLVERFEGSAGDARWSYGYALYRLKRADAAEAFARNLRNRHDGVRSVSARGLGAVPEVVLLKDGLQAALADKDALVAVEAARALGARELSGRLAAPDLVELIADANRSKRDPSAAHIAVASADALSALKEKAIAAPLSGQLRKSSAFTFPAIAGAYVASGGDEAAPVLTELLNKSDTGEPLGIEGDWGWYRRQSIAVALGSAKADADGLAGLALKLSNDADGRVRWAALQSYSGLASKKEATNRLLLGLDDNESSVVATAAEVLSSWKVEGAADAIAKRLTDFAEKDPETAVTLVTALGNYGRKQDHAQLIELLDHRSRAVALAAGRVLRASDASIPTDGADGVVPLRFPTLPEYAGIQDLLRAKVRTTKGVIVLHLFPREAPLTVLNFARLARRGFYDDIVLHRVVPGFVAQAGDPRSDGWGGPGFGIPCELTDHPYTSGTVGMALAGRDTGGSQFFFALTPQPHLEARYSVFARVARGMDVVYSLERGDRILSIDVP